MIMFSERCAVVLMACLPCWQCGSPAPQPPPSSSATPQTPAPPADDADPADDGAAAERASAVERNRLRTRCALHPRDREGAPDGRNPRRIRRAMPG
jgi:hypothetical protein